MAKARSTACWGRKGTNFAAAASRWGLDIWLDVMSLSFLISVASSVAASWAVWRRVLREGFPRWAVLASQTAQDAATDAGAAGAGGAGGDAGGLVQHAGCGKHAVGSPGRG